MRLLHGLIWGSLAISAASQPVKVWVELRDKGPTTATGRAWEDAPVHAPHLDSLRNAGLTPVVVLKWQNRVSGWIEPSRIPELRRLPPVRRVEAMPRKAPYPGIPDAAAFGAGRALGKRADTGFGKYRALFEATQASALRAAVAAAGLKPGQGVRIAQIDAGFYLGQKAFRHIWDEHRIKDQWDFVTGNPMAAKDSLMLNPFSGLSHGGAVLSLIAARYEEFEGLAPDAEFLFYRAEDDANETYVEEDYVAAALERAVDSGAQVINVSLGYRYGFTDGSPDIPYSAFNGRTRPSSLAALGAARRNALVCVSMGNNGVSTGGEPTLSAPADADSILSAGIARYGTQTPCDYSSGGPTADGRVKPELVTSGASSEYYCSVHVVPTWVYDDPYNNGFNPSGTSFAAPVITGIAALLRQLHPGAPAQAVRSALIATAGRASSPDSGVGYGLVQAGAAHQLLSGGTHVRTRTKRSETAGAGFRDARGRAISRVAARRTPVFRMEGHPSETEP